MRTNKPLHRSILDHEPSLAHQVEGKAAVTLKAGDVLFQPERWRGASAAATGRAEPATYIVEKITAFHVVKVSAR